GRKPLHHADQSTLGGGVIAVSGFASLRGGRANQNDVSAALLALHLCHGVLHQRKSAVEVDGHRGAPLLVGHGVDGGVGGGPDAVIDHQNVKRSEAFDGGADQRLGGRGSREISLHGVAVFGPTLGDEFFGLGRRMLV